MTGNPSRCSAALFAVVTALGQGVAAQATEEAAAALRGRVLDEEGRPIAGAAIAFVAEDWTTADVLQHPQVRSGDAGEFALPAALERAVLGARAFAIAAPGRATALITNAGDIYIDFARLAAAGGDVGDVLLPTGIELRGRVRTTAAEPLGGARVAAESALQHVVPAAGLWAVHHTSAGQCGADGTFELQGVVGTGVAVSARAIGCRRETRTWCDGTENLLFELQPSGEVRGRLLAADGAPVRGMAVLRFVNGECCEQRTAADGSFRIGIELPGSFTVHGHAFTPTWDYTWADAARPAQPDAAVELRLPARSTVRVAVRDQVTGKPVADAAVHVDWLYPEWADQAPFGAVIGAVPLLTDKDGVVAVPGPAPGRRLHGLVVVQKAGYATHIERHVERPEGKAAVDIRIVPGAVVTGFVREKATGRAVAGAHVALYRENEMRYANLPFEPPIEAIAAKDGRYKLVDAPAGKLQLIVTAPGHVAGEPIEVETAAGGVAKAPEVGLAAAFRMNGRLVGAENASSWRARASAPGESAFAATWAVLFATPFAPVERGLFTLTDLRGDVRLQVAMPVFGVAYGRLLFDLGAAKVGKDLEQAFELGKVLPGRLRGQLRIRGAAVPLHRFAVVITNTELDETIASRVLDREGRFELPVLPDHQWARIVDLATGAVVAQRHLQVPLASTQELSVDVELAEVHVVCRGDGDRLLTCRLHVETGVGDDLGWPVPFSTGLALPLSLAEGATEFALVLPERTTVLSLQVGRMAGSRALAEATCDPKVGKPQTVELELQRR